MQYAMKSRFRGYLPVVVDVETAGFNYTKDALLEVAAQIIEMDNTGFVYPGEIYSYHIEPFVGANLDPKALEFTKINLHSPLRKQIAKNEKIAMIDLIQTINNQVQMEGCKRAILVGHNSHFDLNFFNAACHRNKLNTPFHKFSSLDTAALGGLAYGQTVLRRACIAAGIEFNDEHAHSAKYDTERTAELFCKIVNRYKELGGWV